MSQLRSSLAVDEFRDSMMIETQLELVKPRQELSNASKEPQSLCRVVKVSGSITVSF